MVFITAGMGGGTGTGAAPVIARVARESGILTVGVVTKPFHFEGVHRMRIAETGIEELQKYVDTLIIIPNQNLFRIANERTTFADAFKMADDVLHSGVRGVTDLMVMPGLINLDFADIRTVMSEMGKAMMGTGEAEGERRAIDAAEAAISNPLLEDVSMKGARGVLINITGGTDMTLFEVDEAANRIREEVDPDANIIFGSTFDEKLAGKMRISVVATGIEAEAAAQGERAPALVARAGAIRRRRAPAPGYTQPILTQNAATPPVRAATRGREPARAESPPTPPAGRRGGGKRGGAQRRLHRAAAGRCRPGPPGAADPAGRAAGRRARAAAAAARPRAEPDRAGHRRRPRPAAAAAAPPPPRRGRTAPPPAPRAPAQPRLAPLEPERAAGRQQGRRSARHPGLSAPPGELNADAPAQRMSERRSSCRCTVIARLARSPIARVEPLTIPSPMIIGASAASDATIGNKE